MVVDRKAVVGSAAGGVRPRPDRRPSRRRSPPSRTGLRPRRRRTADAGCGIGRSACPASARLGARVRGQGARVFSAGAPRTRGGGSPGAAGLDGRRTNDPAPFRPGVAVGAGRGTGCWRCRGHASRPARGWFAERGMSVRENAPDPGSTRTAGSAARPARSRAPRDTRPNQGMRKRSAVAEPCLGHRLRRTPHPP